MSWRAPGFLRRVGQRWPQNRPLLWLMRLHVMVFVGLFGLVLLSLSAWLVPVRLDNAQQIDTFFLILLVLSVLVLAPWLYLQFRDAPSIRVGLSPLRAFLLFGGYLAIVALVTSWAYVFAGIVQLRTARLITLDRVEHMRSVFRFGQGETASNLRFMVPSNWIPRLPSLKILPAWIPSTNATPRLDRLGLREAIFRIQDLELLIVAHPTISDAPPPRPLIGELYSFHYVIDQLGNKDQWEAPVTLGSALDFVNHWGRIENRLDINSRISKIHLVKTKVPALDAATESVAMAYWVVVLLLLSLLQVRISGWPRCLQTALAFIPAWSLTFMVSIDLGNPNVYLGLQLLALGVGMVILPAAPVLRRRRTSAGLVLSAFCVLLPLSPLLAGAAGDDPLLILYPSAENATLLLLSGIAVWWMLVPFVEAAFSRLRAQPK